MTKDELIELVYAHRVQMNKMNNEIDSLKHNIDAMNSGIEDARKLALELSNTNRFRIMKRLALSKELAASLT